MWLVQSTYRIALIAQVKLSALLAILGVDITLTISTEPINNVRPVIILAKLVAVLGITVPLAMRQIFDPWTVLERSANARV